MAALIEIASGVAPFYVGKPNSLMMRTALNYLNVHSENTIMVGDRMDTDIVAGVTSGMETILVLSGVTKQEDIDKFPYLPTHIKTSVSDIEPEEFDDWHQPGNWYNLNIWQIRPFLAEISWDYQRFL